MFARLFYIAVGFVVGYMLEGLRQQNQASENEVVDISVTDLPVETVTPKPASVVVESVPESAVEVQAPKGTVYDSPAFLKQINGIGPTYAKRIFEAGINSLELLASKTPAELIGISKVRSQDKAKDWISQAKKLAS